MPSLRSLPFALVLQTILPFPAELKGSSFRHFFFKYFLFSLSFEICLNVDLTKSDDFSRHFCALTQKSRQCRILMTSSGPHTNSARTQHSTPPCSAPVPLHLDDVTTPCHKQTPRDLSPPRHHAPHQSLSIPMTSRLRATNKLRETSALPATMLRTSPSPSR